MTIIVLELLGGLLLLATGSAAFWWVGREDSLSPRQRNSIFAASLAVLVILGAWVGGAGLLVHSATVTYQTITVAARR